MTRKAFAHGSATTKPTSSTVPEQLGSGRTAMGTPALLPGCKASSHPTLPRAGDCLSFCAQRPEAVGLALVGVAAVVRAVSYLVTRLVFHAVVRAVGDIAGSFSVVPRSSSRQASSLPGSSLTRLEPSACSVGMP